ncbi:type VII secretion-associated serine protease mycosin [Rhizocola hellebori]|nr:type VII secretion-associated serine protease mycosin [Rhizocola hellebori]
MTTPSQVPVAPSAGSRSPIATALLRVAASVLLAAVLVAAPGFAKRDAKPKPVAVIAEIPRDSVRSDQWQVDLLKGQKAWRLSTGSGVIVAVIDSGVAADHPDLAGQVLPGIDLVNPGGDGTADAVGHGTTVAGLIAGRSDDGQGVLGLAPDAKILPVRVLDAENKYNDAKVVAEALVWAVDHGATVVNLSLGGGVASPALAEAIDYAFARDVVVVACVGNVLPNGPTSVWHPASEPGVLAVTALTPTGDLWRRSLTGASTVLAAPGSDLVGARPGGYQRVQGTSFAAPLVAATAALIRSRWPQMSAANVVQRLIVTADDTGSPGRDDSFGFGIVDPFGALTADVPEVLTNPLDNTPPPGKSGFGPAASEPSVDAWPPRERGRIRPLPGLSPNTMAATGPVPRGEKPVSLAAAIAGVGVLVVGGLSLVRRL